MITNGNILFMLKIIILDINPYSSDAYVDNKKNVIDNAVTINNTIAFHDIKLKQIIIGNIADKNEEFEYNIKIFNNNNSIITGELNIISNNDNIKVNSTEEGFNMKLKYDDEITITNILDGYSYEISQTDSDYTLYNKVIKTSDNSIISELKLGSSVSNTLNDDHTVIFTNKEELAVQTGLFNNIKPFIILFIFSTFGIISLLFIKLKDNNKVNY